MGGIFAKELHSLPQKRAEFSSLDAVAPNVPESGFSFASRIKRKQSKRLLFRVGAAGG